MKGLFVFITLLSSFASATVLSQNDISILMPFPNSADDGLLRATTTGAYGELLPREIYKKMPSLMIGPAEEIYRNLRVVGIRLDPCFLKTPSPDSCQPQVRMTWQPLKRDFDQNLVYADAAVHTLYDVPPEDFQKLLTDLRALKSQTRADNITDEILEVHPLLQAEGMSGPFARRLLPVILSRVGAERLMQTTFMTLSGGETVWAFGGLVRKDDVFTLMSIPRIPRKAQVFTNASVEADDFVGGMTPAPTGKDTFNLLVTRSDEIRETDEPQVTESALAAFRVENPRLHNPQTMDCVSCHAAQAARVWSLKQYPWLNLDERAGDAKFKSGFNVTNGSAVGDTKLLRAFGYNGRIPAISQRTVNETAAVLELLAKRR